MHIRLAQNPADYVTFGALVQEYLASLDFTVDFQDIEGELLQLAATYGPPGRGVALVAETDSGQLVGITGLRDLGHDRAELKRMYVQPAWQGCGLGRALGTRAIEEALVLGCARIRLDPLARMEAAMGLYRSLGFREIPAYCVNPLPDALFFELTLQIDA